MNLETAEAFQSEHERAARVDLEETETTPFEDYLNLLERLADGDTIDDVLACADCGEPKGDTLHGAIPEQTDAGGPGYFAEDFSAEDFHAFLPSHEAQTVEDYGLESAEDLLDAINSTALDVEVIRKGSLSDKGAIESINLIMTTGGPHDQLNIDDDGYVEHEHVEWFRGPGTETKYVGRFVSLAGYLYDLAEELSEQ